MLQPARHNTLLASAFLLVIVGLSVCHAHGETSQLTPVFPSWQRVIEQLRQATTQQKVSLAASGQYAADALTALASAASLAALDADDTSAADEWPDDAGAADLLEYQGGQAAAQPPQPTVAAAAATTVGIANAAAAGVAAVPQPHVSGEPKPRGAGSRAGVRRRKDEHNAAAAAQNRTIHIAAVMPGNVSMSSPSSSSSSNSSSNGSSNSSSTINNTDDKSNGSTESQDSAVAVHLSSLNRQDFGISRGGRGRGRLGAPAAPGPATTSPVGSEGSGGVQTTTSPASASTPAEANTHKQQNPLAKLLQPNHNPNLFWWQTGADAEQHEQQQQKQATVPSPTADEAHTAEESDKKLVSQKIMPREPLHISPPPSIVSVASIDMTQKLLQIPSSFMGISHEWHHVEDINTAPGYKAAIKLLSSYGAGHFIIRVGGGSSDSTKDLLPHNVYRSLNQVHKETGAKFILGLNFQDTDVPLTRGQMQRARNGLTQNALVTFELGNEPNFYNNKRNMTALEYSRCCFTTEWTDFARNLSCPCGKEQCCVDGQFAGPAWGHVNVYPSTFKWFLESAAQYVSLVTVHWYKATKELPNTPVSLLDDAPIRQEMDNLKQLVQVANSFGKPLRVAEMNTISNSGRLGVSNVFAAALWTLDGAFEVAAAGAVGINLHQGAGQNLYTGILRREEHGKLKPVVFRPAFYGMLMFQQAVADGSILLDKQLMSADAPDIKLWPLLGATSGELRLVIINKNSKLAATQVIKLAGDASSKYQSIARLSRLVAQGNDPLSATSGITLGGHYYAAGCREQGQDQTLMLEADAGPTQQLAWSIYLPPGSATLVRIPLRAGVV